IYKYEDGIVDFLEQETKQLTEVSSISIISKEVSHELEKEALNDDIRIKMAFKYTREDESKTMIEFLNGSNLIHHGTIYEGLLNGIRVSINKFIRENGMYKKGEK